MKNLKYIAAVFLISSFFVSCESKKGNTQKEEPEEAHDHEEENQTEVSLTESQLKAIKLELGKLEMKELKDVIKANGFLKVPNQNKAQVTPLYSGQIKSIRVQPGDYIKKGQTIAVIENPNQVMVQEQYLNVVGQIQLTQTEVNRQQELYEGNAGALKNLQYAESQLRTLQTQRASLAKQLQMMGISPGSVSAKNLHSTMTVKAPISGVVGSVLVDIGSYVDVSFPVAEIVDNSSLHLDLDVFEKDLLKIRKGKLIHFTLTNNPAKEYDAEIFSVGSTFEDRSKAVPVHAKVRGDKSGLIDGMNVVALISIGENLVSAVPTDAIVNEGAEDFIFIQKTEEHGHSEEEHGHQFTFEKIPVAKGVTDVGFTQITTLKEIPENSKIVIKGAFFLLAKMNNTGEEGHAH